MEVYNVYFVPVSQSREAFIPLQFPKMTSELG